MAETLLDEELTEGLKQAKKTPRNFALIVKGQSPVKLLVQKKKFREAELMKAKTEAKGNDIITGVLQASGSDFAFLVLGDAEPGVKTMKLKELISEQTELTAKPRWELVNELPDVQDNEDDQPQVQSATVPPVAPPPIDDRAKQIADGLKSLAPRIQQGLTQQPGRKEELFAAVGRVKATLAASQLDDAQAALATLVALLKSLQTEDGGEHDRVQDSDEEELNELFFDEEDTDAAEDETASTADQIPAPQPLPTAAELAAMIPPPPPAATSPVLSGRAAWEEARETVAENLAQLQSHLAGTNDPDLQKIARHGFQGITGRLQVGLRVALIEFDTGAGEAREKARGKALEIVGQFQEFVASDPLLRLCDENLFGVQVNGRKILGDALQKLAASLKA